MTDTSLFIFEDKKPEKVEKRKTSKTSIEVPQSLKDRKFSFGKVINKPKQNDVKKGATHYESFSIDGHEYKIGDHVKLDPSDDDDDDTDDLEKEFWYALIVDIYYIRDEETTPENWFNISVAWFFKPSDGEFDDVLTHKFDSDSELFVSFEPTDENPVGAVRGPFDLEYCYESIPPPKDRKKGTFYCRFAYNVNKKRFYRLYANPTLLSKRTVDFVKLFQSDFLKRKNTNNESRRRDDCFTKENLPLIESFPYSGRQAAENGDSAKSEGTRRGKPSEVPKSKSGGSNPSYDDLFPIFTDPDKFKRGDKKDSNGDKKESDEDKNEPKVEKKVEKKEERKSIEVENDGKGGIAIDEAKEGTAHSDFKGNDDQNDEEKKTDTSGVVDSEDDDEKIMGEIVDGSDTDDEVNEVKDSIQSSEELVTPTQKYEAMKNNSDHAELRSLEEIFNEENESEHEGANAVHSDADTYKEEDDEEGDSSSKASKEDEEPAEEDDEKEGEGEENEDGLAPPAKRARVDMAERLKELIVGPNEIEEAINSGYDKPLSGSYVIYICGYDVMTGCPKTKLRKIKRVIRNVFTPCDDCTYGWGIVIGCEEVPETEVVCKLNQLVEPSKMNAFMLNRVVKKYLDLGLFEGIESN